MNSTRYISILYKEWRPAKTYDDSEYTTNDKYVNGDYENNYKFKECVYYDECKNKPIKRILRV